MNILYLDLFDVCQNCGAQHQKFSEIPNYEEDDKFQTNALYNQKKIHMPYEYLKETYPEIKLIKIYDFILESIDDVIIADESIDDVIITCNNCLSLYKKV